MKCPKCQRTTWGAAAYCVVHGDQLDYGRPDTVTEPLRSYRKEREYDEPIPLPGFEYIEGERP